jgi:peroxiredoxin Q/BCP
MLSEGDTAPVFEATAHDGSHVKLSDFAGKYVLLWFYPAADTPG